MIQSVTMMKLGGATATFVMERIRSWRLTPDTEAIDTLCDLLRANGESLSVLHYDEWIDGWSMGDLLPGPGEVCGRRYQITEFDPADIESIALRGPNNDEKVRYVSRLREAVSSWFPIDFEQVIVVMRLVHTASALDEEVIQAMKTVPEWLTNCPRLSSIDSR